MKKEIVSLSTDQFQAKLASVCDLRGDGFHLSYGPPVFGPYKDLKHFYGRITANSFALFRNSRFYRTTYFITGNYHPTEDGRTEVTYQLDKNKTEHNMMIIFPILACVLVDIFLYMKTDIPFEGMLMLNAVFLCALIYVPIDNYRGKKLLEVFKEEMEIK